MNPKQKKLIKRASSASVVKLISLAHSEYAKGRKDRAARYITMAWELIKKNKVKVPEEYKNAFCRKCRSVWIPGETATVLFNKKSSCLRIKCNKCGFSKRI